MSAEGLAFLSQQELRKGQIVELIVRMSGLLDLFNGLARVVRADQKAESSYLVAVSLKPIKKKRSAKTYN